MKNKICYVDMDGVLADFEKRLFELHPEIKLLLPNSDERKEAIDKFCESDAGRRIFHDLEPLDGAIESFHLLCEHYDVYMLSTPMWLVPESYSDKRIWVERMLGANGTKKLILTHNKGLLMGDYLVDDRIKHGVDEFKGEHIHFSQPGFENWEKVINYLKHKDKW